MAARISSGILLYRRPGGRLEVLLAHPGGPYFARKDEGHWTIPKGEVDPGGDLIAVGRREFEEETGQPVPEGPSRELGSIVQKGGKVVHAWAVEGDMDPDAGASNTFEVEWPPGAFSPCATSSPRRAHCRAERTASWRSWHASGPSSSTRSK